MYAQRIAQVVTVRTLLFIFLWIPLAISAAYGASPSPQACDYVFLFEGDLREEALRSLPAVFIGRVVKVELVGPVALVDDPPLGSSSFRATFRVRHSWKGPLDTITVDWFSNCEVEFEIGEEYVVFAEYGWNRVVGEEVLLAPIWWETRALSKALATIGGLNQAAARLKKEGIDVKEWRY